MAPLDEERRPSRLFFQMTDECGEIENPLPSVVATWAEVWRIHPLRRVLGGSDYRLVLA